MAKQKKGEKKMTENEKTTEKTMQEKRESYGSQRFKKIRKCYCDHCQTLTT